jgi:hypothetical protein
MREIKFRAWDAENKKMWTGKDCGEEIGRVTFQAYFSDEGTLRAVLLEEIDYGFPRKDYREHELPVMLNIGFQDLYQGDICRITMACGETLVGEVVWDERGLCWALDYGADLWDFGNIINCEHLIEKLGNIHDNPELLEA